MPAEIIALKALEFLAESDGALERFAGETGAGPAGMRENAENPEFLAAVLDFILAHEELAAGFCAAQSMDAVTLHRARRELPGG